MDFSHLDNQGRARMVDVSGKPAVKRRARAEGLIIVGTDVIKGLRDRSLKKGDPLSAARVAGIMAAKRTGELIPLCHPLPLDHISIEFEVSDDRIMITAAAVTSARTGVEMEALTAVSVAALTVYDMCKSVSRDMRIEGIRLVSKEKEQQD
ncbi:MAG: cyclic pyranopterin monophosphate synthase MoaC [Candidatus Krumholzibacteriales bacterium]